MPKLGNIKRHIGQEFRLKALAHHFNQVPRAMSPPALDAPKVAMKCRIKSAAKNHGLPQASEWIGTWSEVTLASASANAQAKLQQVDDYCVSPTYTGILRSPGWQEDSTWCIAEERREQWRGFLRTSDDITICWDGAKRFENLEFTLCRREDLKTVSGMFGICDCYAGGLDASKDIPIEELELQKSERVRASIMNGIHIFCIICVQSNKKNRPHFDSALFERIRQNIRFGASDRAAEAKKVGRRLKQHGDLPNLDLLCDDVVHELLTLLKAPKDEPMYAKLDKHLWSNNNAVGKMMAYSTKRASRLRYWLRKIVTN